MNITKRTFNPLRGRTFRYTQPESAKLMYHGNWGAAIQPTVITSSAWEVEGGTATIANESNTLTTTSALISGIAGEAIVVNRIFMLSGEVDERVLKFDFTSEYGDTGIYDGNIAYLAKELAYFL